VNRRAWLSAPDQSSLASTDRLGGSAATAATSFRPASESQCRVLQKRRSSCTGRRRHRTAKGSPAFRHGTDQSPLCTPAHPRSMKWVASEPKRPKTWRESQQLSESGACREFLQFVSGNRSKNRLGSAGHIIGSLGCTAQAEPAGLNRRASSSSLSGIARSLRAID
jgi:hypothetical protein